MLLANYLVAKRLIMAMPGFDPNAPPPAPASDVKQQLHSESNGVTSNGTSSNGTSSDGIKEGNMATNGTVQQR